MASNPYFAPRLREAIEESGLSRAAVCERAGIARSTLACYLYGHREPRATSLPTLAAALGVSEAWLVGYSDERCPNVADAKKYRAINHCSYSRMYKKAKGAEDSNVRTLESSNV